MKNLNTLFVLMLFCFQCLTSFGQFESLNGPKGMTVTEFCVSTDGDYYLAQPLRGLFRSQDQGETWEPFGNGLPVKNSDIRELTPAPNGDIYLIDYYADLYYLPQGETSWTMIDDFSLMTQSKIAISPDNKVYVTTEDMRIFKAENADSSFVEILNYPETDDFDDVFSFGTDLNFASFSSKRELLHFSDDGAVISVNEFGFGFGEGIQKMEQYSDGTLVMIASEFVFISVDDGASWEKRAIDVSNEFGAVSSGLSLFEILYILGREGVYISYDHAESFEKLTGLPYEHEYLFSEIIFAEDNSAFLFSSYPKDFSYQSKDHGQTWERFDHKFQYSTVQSLVESPDGVLFAETRDVNGFQKSEDKGVSWEIFDVNGKAITELAIHPNGDYFAITESELFRSSDKGQSWENIPLNFLSFSIPHIWITSTGTIFLRELLDVWTSDNLGQTWEVSGYSGNVINYPPAYLPNGDIITASNSEIWRSKDGGENWALLYDDFRPSHAIQVCPNGNVIILGFVLNATPVEYLVLGLENDELVELDYDYPPNFWLNNRTKMTCDCENNIIIANDNEVYKSGNGGQSWEDLLTGMTEADRINILFLDSENHLHLGMYNDGIYKSTDPTCDASTPTFEPTGTNINVQIHPNPMSDFALLEIDSEMNVEYTFRMYDMLGKAIRVEQFSSNVHNFKKGNLNSGIYFYQLEAGHQVLKTGKIVVE